MAFIELAAQLQFQRVDAADELLTSESNFSPTKG
jgi:hypothetical protein